MNNDFGKCMSHIRNCIQEQKEIDTGFLFDKFPKIAAPHKAFIEKIVQNTNKKLNKVGDKQQ